MTVVASHIWPVGSNLVAQEFELFRPRATMARWSILEVVPSFLVCPSFLITPFFILIPRGCRVEWWLAKSITPLWLPIRKRYISLLVISNWSALLRVVLWRCWIALLRGSMHTKVSPSRAMLVCVDALFFILLLGLGCGLG